MVELVLLDVIAEKPLILSAITVVNAAGRKIYCEFVCRRSRKQNDD
jgi:hypothetical protein